MTIEGKVTRLATRISEQRRARRTTADTARNVTPPPPRAFGAFGRNSYIVPPAMVSWPTSIFLGDGVIIQSNSWLSVVGAVEGITPKLTIGDRTQIGGFAHIACVGEIEIGADVLTGARIFIADTYHGYEDPDVAILDQPMATPEKVTIGRGAFLGIDSVVLSGVTIGENAYVAAGAVVTHDVAPRTLVAGNPARAIRRWDPVRATWARVEDP